MADTDLASLSIFPATPAQKLVSLQRTFPEWGRGYTLEEFIHCREEYLDTMEHAIDGKLTVWVLAPREDPATLKFKCSCETYKRGGAILHSATANPSISPLEDVIGYAIASVFTPPSNRLKGYATHMLRLLHWVIAPMRVASFPEEKWGKPPQAVEGHGHGAFSVLYSDVGETFYQRCGPGERDRDSGGWEVRGPISTVWDIRKYHFRGPTTATPVKWLDAEAVTELWSRDATAMRDAMIDPSSGARSHSSHLSGRTTFFTFLPDKGAGAFQFRRTVRHDKEGIPVLPMRYWGLAMQGTHDEPNGNVHLPDTFATWTVDPSHLPPTFVVTRFQATQQTFAETIHHLVEAARDAGMQRIEIWNMPKQFEQNASKIGGKTGKRSEHYPAFKWYGKERNDELEWVFNERFCWC